MSELRGENRLLKASIESLERATVGSGGSPMQNSTDYESSGVRATGEVRAAAPSCTDSMRIVVQSAGVDPLADDIDRDLQEAQREAELEQVAVDLREQVAQLRDETVALKTRLEHSEAQAQKLQVENRAMRAQLESAADSGATDTERLAEVQLETRS